MTRTITIGLFICLLKMACPAEPTAMELLDKFAETVDSVHTSFITQARMDSVSYRNYRMKGMQYLNGIKERHGLVEFRTDGSRMKIITQGWGDYYSRESGKYTTDETKKTYMSDTYDGHKRYSFNKYGPKAKHPGSLIIGTERYTVENRLSFLDHFSLSLGHLEGDIRRFDHILKEAGPEHLSVRQEELNGTMHYVIDADTDHGKYRVWLNPEKGYNLTKAIIAKKDGDLFKDQDVKGSNGFKLKYVIENTEFKEVNGTWVPVKAKTQCNLSYSGSYDIKAKADIELLSIVVNPDHDALDSFNLDDIPNRTYCVLEGTVGIFYWKDGKAEPDAEYVRWRKNNPIR